jgi:hypothetical protein
VLVRTAKTVMTSILLSAILAVNTTTLAVQPAASTPARAPGTVRHPSSLLHASDQDACACEVTYEFFCYYAATKRSMPPILIRRPLPSATFLEYLSGAPVLSGPVLPDYRPDPSDPFYHSGQ